MTIVLRLLFCCALILGSGYATIVKAQNHTAPGDSYRQVPSPDITAGDKALNFGIVYAIQWATYMTTQESVVREHASLKNMGDNILKPHFDKDHFNWNLSKHTLTGQYYYLFYRSRGYEKKNSFEWAFYSSLAFEFTIETATERPSFQDMYQTPVFGSIVGMGAESLSLWFHSLQTLPTTMLGYLFNPFTLLNYPYAHYQLGWRPVRIQNHGGIALTVGADL